MVRVFFKIAEKIKSYLTKILKFFLFFVNKVAAFAFNFIKNLCGNFRKFHRSQHLRQIFSKLNELERKIITPLNKYRQKKSFNVAPKSWRRFLVKKEKKDGYLVAISKNVALFDIAQIAFHHKSCPLDLHILHEKSEYDIYLEKMMESFLLLNKWRVEKHELKNEIDFDVSQIYDFAFALLESILILFCELIFLASFVSFEAFCGLQNQVSNLIDMVYSIVEKSSFAQSNEMHNISWRSWQESFVENDNSEAVFCFGK